MNKYDEDFGAVLNCAVRYCLGRKTYMPGLVIDYITPLLPKLDDRTLWCFERDILEAKESYGCGLGDKNIDEPKWIDFLEKVKEERGKRNIGR